MQRGVVQAWPVALASAASRAVRKTGSAPYSRAKALRVAASRQVAQGGAWVDAPVQAATVQKVEEIILTKARELRQGAVN